MSGIFIRYYHYSRKNPVARDEIAGQTAKQPMWFGRHRQASVENRETFKLYLLPHSCEGFEMEK